MYFKKSTFLIIILSIILFSSKWLLSYYFFKDDLSIKVIFDSSSDGYFYYVYSKAIASLDFNYSFDPFHENVLNNLPIPFYGIILHTILFLLFDNLSILILELLFIFLFIYIFFHIFKKLNLNTFFSLFLSIFYFSIPSFIELFELNNFPYVGALSEISGLRFPRPLIVNVFFYYYIYYLLNLDFKNFFNFKNIIVLSFLLSLTISTFYYFFIIQIISLFIILLNNYKIRDILNLNKSKYYLVFFISFIFFSSPFIYFILTSENDYLERMYVIKLNIEDKLELIKYLIGKFFSIKFLTIILIVYYLNWYINKNKISNYKKINFFLFC